MAKQFRLFFSSTFKDFTLERERIQKEVLSKLSELCEENGFDFMVIDLRWGVEEEVQRNQRALEVCLSEVQACKEEPHPDFVILLGQHYGWVPLPYLIEKEEFEEIYAQIPPRDRERIDHWYVLILIKLLPVIA